MLQTTTDDIDIITSQTSGESNNQQSNSQSSSGSTNSANSSTTPSLSQITSNNMEQTPDSQLSNSSTITLSSPSQTVDISQESKQVADKECQTADGVFLEKEEYEALMKKASLCPDFKDDIFKIRSFISKLTQPEMDPQMFEKICSDAGAHNLYKCIRDAIYSHNMSEERKHLSGIRTMVIIYIMMYSQSQKSNAFQVALSRTLQQFGITKQGLESLRNLGIAAHPQTVKVLAKSSSSTHSSSVLTFIESAIEKNQLIIFCIDDYHNIHTQHRPEAKTQTQAIHMTTLLLKVFPNVKAIPHYGNNVKSKSPVEIANVKSFVSSNLSIISKPYVENMPDWVLAKYFDPEAERQRLLVHDYQQTEIQQMRAMDNTKLVDSIQLDLKSCENVLTALNKMLSSGLNVYLSNFIAPFVGHWPMQFFLRQLIYSSDPLVPSALKNVVPFIGPLHVSLNARECVLLNFHQVFADLYSFLFGKKAKLAKKPKPWRISLLLEVIYGGWTLIRDMILSVFHKCKDIEFLTLLNLLDNYTPLVLSIYSIVFKCNKYELFCQSLLHCWVMFVVFQRRHYNKALLIMLSAFLHLQENASTMSDTLRQNLVAFDEYTVENFHSILRKRTKETDTADEISFKAKEIDACKHELHSFQSIFVPPRRFHFSSKKINKLKEKAAKFLTLKFQDLYYHPGMAVQQPWARRQPKHTSKWKLPNLFGEYIVTNRVLPLGFTSVETPPDPSR